MRAIIYYNKLRYADDVVILASTEDNLLALVNIIWHSSIIIIIIYTPRKHFCQLFRMFCFPLAYPPQHVTWRDWTRLRHLCSGVRWTWWAQYGIDLPGSLHTNKIPVILGRYPLPRFFCRLSIAPLDMDNGTFNSSHPDVVEKVNFLVPASQYGGTSVAEGSP